MMITEVQKSVISLFKSFVVEEKDITTNKEEPIIIEEYGIILDGCLKSYENLIIPVVKNLYKMDKINNTFFTFYESLKKEQEGTRVIYQLLHYLSTYGLNLDRPFIPNELYGKIPEGVIKSIIYIRAITPKELKDKFMSVANYNVGISQENLGHLCNIAEYLYEKGLLTKDEIEKIPNRDLKMKLYCILKVYPTDIDEMITYLCQVYANSKKIKSRYVLDILKNDTDVKEDFYKYIKQLGEQKAVKTIAEKFYRNKEYLLSIKLNNHFDIMRNNVVCRVINKASKLAKKIYKPVKEFIRIAEMDFDNYKKFINSLPIYKKVRILQYFIKLRKNLPIYFIRNGKLFIDFFGNLEYEEKFFDFEKYLKEKIKEDLYKIFPKDLAIHPSCRITLPASSTLFIGTVPVFSRYKFSKQTAVIGIHWFNIKDKDNELRVDLDLGCSRVGKVFGWNYGWASEKGDILYSGDMTDAPFPDGAVEYFAISDDDPKLLSVNSFNYDCSTLDRYDFSFTILILESDKTPGELEGLTKDNFALAIPQVRFFKRGISLGILVNKEFVFAAFGLTSSGVLSETYQKFLPYLVKFSANLPTLNDFFTENENGITFNDLTLDFWKDYFK